MLPGCSVTNLSDPNRSPSRYRRWCGSCIWRGPCVSAGTVRLVRALGSRLRPCSSAWTSRVHRSGRLRTPLSGRAGRRSACSSTNSPGTPGTTARCATGTGSTRPGALRVRERLVTEGLATCTRARVASPDAGLRGPGSIETRIGTSTIFELDQSRQRQLCESWFMPNRTRSSWSPRLPIRDRWNPDGESMTAYWTRNRLLKLKRSREAEVSLAALPRPLKPPSPRS